jgi:hypothetical protein
MIRPSTAVVVAVLALVTVSCGGSDESSAVTVPPVELSALTTAGTTVPATTVPATTSPATTAPAATTTTSTTSAPTTTVKPTGGGGGGAAPPCSIDLIVQQTETRYDGITPSDVRCADVWASWVGRPDDPMADGFFAVAKWDGGTWVLANLGSAEICGDAGVPERLWDALDCIE